MSLNYSSLSDLERPAYAVALNFVRGRLFEQETIDWALRLQAHQRIERIAISQLLDHLEPQTTDEPWLTAWRLITESWAHPEHNDRASTIVHELQRRLSTGDRSRSIVSEVANLVSPRLSVRPIPPWSKKPARPARKPKAVEQILWASVTSGKLIDLTQLQITKLTDLHFLTILAQALEWHLNAGLDLMRRLGQVQNYHLQWVHRAHYVSPQGSRPASEPDAYSRGMAPVVKLLHAIVMRIAELDLATARRFIGAWRISGSPLYCRLWAAAARDRELASSEEVGPFLLALSDIEFWHLHYYPEIADLRATRFNDLDDQTKRLVVKRIRKGRPPFHKTSNADATTLRNARLQMSARELMRIEAAGGNLEHSDTTWLRTISTQLGIHEPMAIDDGFPQGTQVGWGTTAYDPTYDTLQGVHRLRALEAALSTNFDPHHDQAEAAREWIHQSPNAELVLNDLEAIGTDCDDFPLTWVVFGWAHANLARQPSDDASASLQDVANRVLCLVGRLSDETLSIAIDGVCAWLDAWNTHLRGSPHWHAVWQRVWPLAVSATNIHSDVPEEPDLNAALDDEPPASPHHRIDTLNPPAGKLISCFLAACPTLVTDPNPFSDGSALRLMRDKIVSAEGRSGLIGAYRLTEHLPYFLHADAPWTEKHLITPLISQEASSLAVWTAIGRHPLSSETMKLIGPTMADRAGDPKLERDTRQNLVFSLVVEQLHAFRAGREPAVPHARITQLLRTVDDEIRGTAAQAIQQFVSDLSSNKDINASASELFQSAAAPFLLRVWPQERSLATPGVSSALAELPASSCEAFADAVTSVERFLVPFDCWSLHEYGFRGTYSYEECRKLHIIDDDTKAEKLLRLLDLTIGNDDGAVTPRDLTDALDRIRSVSPKLVNTTAFQRLSTAARR
jgi:hypothetical protein